MSAPAAPAPAPDRRVPLTREQQDVRNLLARRDAIQRDRRFSAQPVAPTGFGGLST